MGKLFRGDETFDWYRRRRRRRVVAAVQGVSPPLGIATLGGLVARAAGAADVPTNDVPTNDVPNSFTGSGPTVTVPAAATAALGRLSATATGRRTVVGAAHADLGALAATADGTLTTALGGSGSALNPQIYLVDRDTGALSPLPEWGTLQVSPVADAVGACTLAYPVGGSGFDTLNANVGPSGNGTLDQEIEIRLVGTATGRSRWLLQQKEGDDLQRGSLWTFTGVSLEQLLAEVLVGGTTDLTFSGANAGVVLATVFDAIQLRSAALLPDMTRDFTTLLDSGGAAWTHTVSDLKFGPTDTLLSVAAALADLGMCEFRVSPGHVLQAYEPGGRGRDRSTGVAPLRFAQGTNLAKADRRESARVGDAATAVLAKGSDGVYQWVTDATAEAVRGRRVEATHDAGQLSAAGSVAAAGQTKLDVIKYGVSERSHGIVFGPGSVIPGVDFDVADWGLSFVGGEATRLRIAQWTVSFERELGKASGTVTMNDVIADRLVALQRQLNAQSRGGAVVGTSTSPALTDDGKIPHAPTGLTCSSTAYRDADGATLAAVSAAWSAVTTNDDGTAADDVSSYQVQFSYDGSTWVTAATVHTPAADWDNVVAGVTLNVRVAAVDYIGHVSAFSSTFTLTTGADATPPPVPSAPTVSNYIGLLRIDWDGLGTASESMPPDFDRVEIYASQASTFAVGDVGVTKVGEIRGKQSYPWSPPGSLGDVDYDITWYVRLRSVDRSENASALSVARSAVPGKVAEGDIASANIGVLTAGIMNALMTVSGTISTGTTGQSRVTLDSTGLYAFNSSNVALLSYSIVSQVLQIVGKVTAGDLAGARAILDPLNLDGLGAARPGLLMYHDTSSNHSVIYGRLNSGASGGSQFYVANRSDQQNYNGAFLRGDADQIVLGFRTGLLTGPTTINGGQIFAYPQGSAQSRIDMDYATTSALIARVSAASTGVDLNALSGGVVKSFLSLGTSGDAHLDSGGGQMIAGSTANNYFIANSSGASVISGGSVKSFVIDHPTDADRYLVHVCTESPYAGVEYWDTAVIEDELAIVQLPAYFEALAEEDGRAVFLQPELITIDSVQAIPRVVTLAPGDDGSAPLGPPETRVIRRPLVFSAMPSEVKGGQFHIIAPGAPDGARVHWQVKARRRDVTFEVEPLRSDVTVAGDGPYRFIVTDPA